MPAIGAGWINPRLRRASTALPAPASAFTWLPRGWNSNRPSRGTHTAGAVRGWARWALLQRLVWQANDQPGNGRFAALLLARPAVSCGAQRL